MKKYTVEAPNYGRFLGCLVKFSDDNNLEGDYIFNLPGIGLCRFRKTGKKSFQLDKTSIPKPELQKKLVALKVEDPSPCSVTLFKGDYSEETEAAALETETVAKQEKKSKKKKKKKDVEATDKPKKKKKKKKKDEDVIKSPFENVTTSQLNDTYKKKQVKNALTAGACFKKKVNKAILQAITFDGKNTTGQDILDGVEAVTNETISSEMADVIFENL